MAVKYELRYASNLQDFKEFSTERLRKEFLVERLLMPEEVNLVYTLYDRMIVGGAMPVKGQLVLDTIEPLKSDHFLSRREIGIFNIGGKGRVKVESKTFELDYKEALYLGSGDRHVSFESENPMVPARFYFNSAPAHQPLADKKITLAEAERSEMGRLESSNARRINKMIVGIIVNTCQLQMGMTELKPGSVWNTMPVHLHDRRTEIYFYFELPENQAICHFMGEPKETRHLWLANQQAVISPPWSIHSAAGTSNYVFIWGMAGENLNYSDMDTYEPNQLK